MQGLKAGGASALVPLVTAATDWMKFKVPVIVPVTVAAPVVSAVASAVIMKPQIYVVLLAAAASVAVVAAVVPVPLAVIGVAPVG